MRIMNDGITKRVEFDSRIHKDMPVLLPVQFAADLSDRQILIDILPVLKDGDSHFTEANRCALTCAQDLQLLHGLTPPVRRPICCAQRSHPCRGSSHIPGMSTHAH